MCVYVYIYISETTRLTHMAVEWKKEPLGLAALGQE